MMDLAVIAATGAAKASDAWQAVLSKRKTASIKINALGGPRIATSPLLVEGLARCLNRQGISPENVIVWDRSRREMEEAGYRFSDKNLPYRCRATDQTGYDEKVWEYETVGSMISRLVTNRKCLLVSFGVLKDHSITGVSGSIKNLMGVIHNPNKYHLSGGDPAVAHLLGLAPIRQSLGLGFLDCFHFQCNRGPAFHPKWIRNQKCIMASTDPVALDAAGWRLVDKVREENGLPTLKDAGREPQYLRTCSKLGFGRLAPDSIRFVEKDA